jgi:tRNA-Thr(GGU) m(6)t(6)A37 methyltransferase TsaA
MQPFAFTPIGLVHSPFVTTSGMPLQAVAAQGAVAIVELYPQYAEGLQDIAGFSHLWLLTWLHATSAPTLRVTPYLDDQPRGVFATRAPRRPNPLGLSLVRLIDCEMSDGKALLHVQDIDLLDKTPLLDIKPYVPQFDTHPYRHSDTPGEVRIGWFTDRVEQVYTTRADDRMK